MALERGHRASTRASAAGSPGTTHRPGNGPGYLLSLPDSIPWCDPLVQGAERKVSSRLRHVSSSGLYQGLLRGLVDPRDGGQFRWLWSAVPEALGVGGVGRVGLLFRLDMPQPRPRQLRARALRWKSWSQRRAPFTPTQPAVAHQRPQHEDDGSASKKPPRRSSRGEESPGNREHQGDARGDRFDQSALAACGHRDTHHGPPRRMGRALPSKRSISSVTYWLKSSLGYTSTFESLLWRSVFRKSSTCPGSHSAAAIASTLGLPGRSIRLRTPWSRTATKSRPNPGSTRAAKRSRRPVPAWCLIRL